MVYRKGDDLERAVLHIISSFAHKEMAASISLESELKYNLGFDSLTMLEICVKIESVFKVSMEGKLNGIKKVGDIIAFIENYHGFGRNALLNIDDYPLSYPLPKKPKHVWWQRCVNFIKRIGEF